ncbi:16S rRNA (cytosine(1402)-N(4))-methyltransferase RsmH [Fulvivirga sediminis]|uniref:Ribosomal RNA small subunit methyltransferase H n=1 Tax=Fulvivirga sediminis TaxID=2803949 RepID=A0A937F534_9BACT|nr:16S rRNA (cytosine(1402)-N(4))-methyltransferase RsmH [Fulvivirga sediminis]MBL3656567.1 16S rRNA (cytosine(1402)-N(4))-methyltransferase RsmH [Fulvivirga sediminis]
MSYHDPVMLAECIDALNIKPNGVYVDLTFGGGGHTKAILAKLDGGRLFSFDQDQDAKANADGISDESFTFIEGNFRHLRRYLKMYGVKSVDGILADLGISSHQIDAAERGFSTRFDAELDMRMDQSASKSARDVLNTYSQDELHKIFGMYGEVKNAKTLAAAIVARRTNTEITTVNELKDILSKYTKRGKENRYYAQVFQAIRIEVNEELKALEEALEQSAEVLSEDGRLVVMSYHSLEDRLVKNFIAKGKMSGEVEKDFYGNVLRPLEPVNRKPIVADDSEIERNNRARSAKLRIGRKL